MNQRVNLHSNDVEFINVENEQSYKFCEDWDDSNEPLKPIVNECEFDPKIFLGLKRRRSREDAQKRKLCYSRTFDDGYGFSIRLTKRCRNPRISLRSRGKRFRSDTHTQMNLSCKSEESKSLDSLSRNNDDECYSESFKNWETKQPEMDPETHSLMLKMESSLRFDN